MMKWLRRHDARTVPMRAIIDKLVMCRDHGIDIDKIPMNLTVSELLRLPVDKLKELAHASGTAH